MYFDEYVGCNSKQLPLVVNFIDSRKTFDSIDSKQMVKILKYYGISQDLVNAFNTLYTNSNSSVIVDELLSEDFEVDIGVLKGDVLVPLLFIIMMDVMLRRSQ